MADPAKDMELVSEQKHVLLMDERERQTEACRRVFGDTGRAEFVAAEKKGEELYLAAKPMMGYADVHIYESAGKDEIDLNIQSRMTGEWSNVELAGDKANEAKTAKKSADDLRQFVSRLGWVSSSKENQWKDGDLAAKMGDNAGKAEVAQALENAETGINSYSEHAVAKALGVIDAALEAGDFGTVADVFNQIRPLAEKPEIVGAVVEAMGGLISAGGDNLAIQSYELARIVTWTGEKMPADQRTRLAEAAVLGDAYWGSKAEGNKLWEEQRRKYFTIHDPRQTVHEIAEQAGGTGKEAAVLGKVMGVLEKKTSDMSAPADELYGLAGNQTLGEYIKDLREKSPVVAGVYEKVAAKLSAVLESKEAIVSGGGSVELFRKHFADREKAKIEAGAQAVEAMANVGKKVMAAVETEKKKAEEERKKTVIESAAAELRKELDPKGLWKEERDLLRRGKGTYVATDEWRKLYGEISKEIRSLRDRGNLSDTEAIKLGALEQHEVWLREGSKDERAAGR